MWQPFLSRSRTIPRRPRSPRVRRSSLERLEERQLLSYADFELSSLLPANDGDGSKGFVVSGIVDRGRLGGSSAYQPLGDVNGDSIDDMLLSAPGPGFSSPPDTYGQVYLIFGRPGDLPAELNLQSLDPTTGYLITGIELGDRLGGTSGGGSGDINHDRILDIVIASDGRSPSGDRLDGGRTLVIYGGNANLAMVDLADGTQDGRISLAGLNGTYGFVINGIAAPGVTDSAGTLAGRASAAGDVNGDGVDDLVIGANGGAPAKPGRVFVVFGRGPGSSAGASFPATLELAGLSGTDGFVIPGLGATDSLGTSAGGGGDVNGDGIGDLVIGAQFASPSGRSLAGQAYVIFGRTSFPATFNLASLNGANGFKVNGGAANDYLGAYTADVAGDVNDDGIDDILLGAWGVDGPDGSSAGAAYVIFGKTTGFSSAVEVTAFTGSNGFAVLRTGSSVAAAGDVNGDGYDDIITGAYSADPNGITDAGQSYVIYGGPSFWSSLDVTSLAASSGGDGSAGFVLNGFIASGNSGTVGAIGDINGDGVADVRVGALSVDLNGLTDNGQAYIVYGKPSPASGTKFYAVNDASTDRTYEYSATSSSVEDYSLNSGNTAPRGAASTAAGNKVWVVDTNKNVYVYNTSGGLLGSWTAGSLASNATVEGIATNGIDIWIVDTQQDKVFRYTGAASRLSGSQNAASSFNLNSSNTSPKDIVTDGTNLWVVNDSSTDKVFKYNMSGTLLGSWTISGAGGSPTGITLDPSGGGTLWIVDTGSDRVYQFDNARGLTSGSLSPSTSFALAAGNTNPQGIADPPVGLGLPVANTTRVEGHVSRPRSLMSSSPRYLSPAAFTHDPGRQLGFGPDVEVSLQLDPIATPLPTAPLAIGLSKRLRPAQRFPRYLGLE